MLPGLVSCCNAAISMSCWPGQLGLVRRGSLVPIPATASVDIWQSPEPFEVLGGGDIEALRSALSADHAPCEHCHNSDKLDDRNLQEEEYRVFRRRDEYILAIHIKTSM